MFFIRIPEFALTPLIQDKSLMRSCRSWGSVRGVLGNRHPYRDRLLAYVTGLVNQKLLLQNEYLAARM